MSRAAALMRRHSLDAALLLPLAVFVFGFTLTPVLSSVRLGLTDAVSQEFPSLANYRAMFAQEMFWASVKNTLLITGIGLSLEMFVALCLALMLARTFKGRGLFRSLLLLPMGVPSLVAAVVMSYIFSLSGYANAALLGLGLRDVPVVWSGGGLTTLLTIVVADMWKVTPMVTLMLLAGLQAIPIELYEAADVDGVSTWQKLTRITLPLLRPAITMALVIRAIDAFRIFDLSMVLGGQVTPVVTTFSYFEWSAYNNRYTSGAGATVLLAMILVFVIGYLRIVEARQEDLE